MSRTKSIAHKLFLGILLAMGIGSGAAAWMRQLAADTPQAETQPYPSPRPLQYRDIPLERGVARVLHVPADSRWIVEPAIAPGLLAVRQFAEESGAIAVLNGGFFDPTNQQTTSYIIRDGEVVADPAENARLTENPDLAPYLSAILNRSEFRSYVCNGDRRYDIALRNDPVPIGCELRHALGGGPQLLPELTDEEEAFVAYAGEQRVRDALGRDFRNARTAIGITQSGDLIWVVAAQQAESAPQSGASLLELADVMRELGAFKAMNLYGGSSSSMSYDGVLHFGRLDSQGQPIERAVKSVLLLRVGAE
ncbi:MAG: phosphodiester glycosidase family protein [Cyanobacteria bacterium P01_D01_bin.123]